MMDCSHQIWDENFLIELLELILFLIRVERFLIFTDSVRFVRNKPFNVVQ